MCFSTYGYIISYHMEGNNRKILLSLSNNGIAISYLQDGMIPVINCCGHKSLSSLLKDMRNNDINCELKTDYGEYIVLKTTMILF